MKLCLAAIETCWEHAAACAAVRAPNVLTSFFYAGYKGAQERVEWTTAMRAAQFRMVDSGAFTLRMAVMKLVGGRAGSAAGRGIDYDEYLAKYIAWVQAKARSRVLLPNDVWIEMDIDAVTSEAWVVKQRERMIACGLGRGLVNVWHSNKDWDYWLYLLREAMRPGRSGYVAIEGNQINREPLDYVRYLRAAYQRGVKVHCFRMTSAEAMRRWPFYSVDSSSWIASTMHGNYTCITRTGGATQTRSKSTGAQTRVWRGVIPAKGTTEKLRLDILIKSARTWVRCGDQVDAMWRARGVDWDKAIAAPEIAA